MRPGGPLIGPTGSVLGDESSSSDDYSFTAAQLEDRGGKTRPRTPAERELLDEFERLFGERDDAVNRSEQDRSEQNSSERKKWIAVVP